MVVAGLTDVAAQRVAAVGAKWRRKHERLLEAVG